MPLIRSISLSASRFDALAQRLAAERGADMLLSPSTWPGESRSFIGINPVAELVMHEDTALEDVKAFAFSGLGPVLGYISYTYGLGLRGVASTKQTSFPAGHLKRYAVTILYDAVSSTMVISAPNEYEVERIIGLASDISIPAPSIPSTLTGDIFHSMDRQEYEDGVRETLSRIRDGWTYQLNLSIRFSRHCPTLDPLSLFMGMRRRYPAPYYGWFSSNQYRILSASPERFLKVDSGQVLTQPIKGTLAAPNLSSPYIDQLVSSSKEDAELSMIVDLLRNDISANCEYGSVCVPRHKEVFHVDSLLQMYSDVTGTLRHDRDCLDLFFDAFPGGSITGCPKQSSMKIIEELEPHTRDVYCGSLVCINGPHDMDSSIAIRTAVFDTKAETLDTWAGSGIVMDSDPASEYRETIAKAAKFLK